VALRWKKRRHSFCAAAGVVAIDLVSNDNARLYRPVAIATKTAALDDGDACYSLQLLGLLGRLQEWL
jgi:hypothetical protein